MNGLALVNLMRDIAVENMRATAYSPGSLYDARREAGEPQEPYTEGEEEGEDEYIPEVD